MKFLTNKRTLIICSVLVAIGVVAVLTGGKRAQILSTETIHPQDINRTVLATGEVTSQTDLNLSFKVGGVLARIPVKVGSKVKSGDILAALDQKDQLAALTSARGVLAGADANYQKVIAGASSEDIVLAERGVASANVAVNNAKRSLQDTKQQQAVLVKNALYALNNSTLSAVAAIGNVSSVTVTISGAYVGDAQGTYTVKIYATNNGPRFTVSGLEGADGQVKPGVQIPLGSKGLFMEFSAVSVYDGDTWTIDIPNMKASNYVTNKNAYESALQTQSVAVSAAENAVTTAVSSLDQAMAILDTKRAEARPADIAAAKAQILSAQGQLQAALASVENTIIRAPADGTITLVDIKIGEQATALKPVITLQDVGNLYVEANVSEANVAHIKLDQPVELTFDALGGSRKFSGKLLTVDPASTVVSGVVNYKITASVDQVTDIKPGMTANMSVLIGSAKDVLAVPGKALVEHDGKKFVRVITDEKKQRYKETEVTTGLEADGGTVEIKSGLKAGQTIVTFVEPKK